jgi:hypothetical protein
MAGVVYIPTKFLPVFPNIYFQKHPGFGAADGAKL